MMMSYGLQRRHFFLTGLSFLLVETISPRAALSQISSLPASEPSALTAFAMRDELWRAAIADVLFLQSWRLELAPLGDERSGAFAADIVQFRNAVFGARTQILTALPGMPLPSLRERFLLAFSERRAGYENFLGGIGVAPDGRAGQRLTTSMFVFANLSFAAVGIEQATVAQRRSFFWPFC